MEADLRNGVEARGGAGARTAPGRRAVTGTVTVSRGRHVESRHRVHVVVADAAGRTVLEAGDPGFPTFLRSAAKPFQALPLVEDGVVEAMGLTPRELALCCGSHGGEPEHVEGVRALLGKIGLDEAYLECGAHPPLLESEAGRLLAEGRAPGRVHNNCSGKHAGMLALARHHGWEPTGYRLHGHPVQRRMGEEIERWTGLEDHGIGRGVDGCGVVCFSVPLARMAVAFARFAVAATRGEPAADIVDAMTAHPRMVAGTGRLDTAVMERAGERVFAKTGAEGVHGAGLRERGWGVALKVEDGARRAADAALIGVLESLEVLTGVGAKELREIGAAGVRNTRDEEIGRVSARIELHPPVGRR